MIHRGLLFVVAGLLSWTSAATAVSDPLGNRIAAAFTRDGVTPVIERSAMDEARTRRIVIENIDPRLADGATGFAGRDYRFIPADGLARHAGTLTIGYPSAPIAAEKARLVAGGDRVFRGSKILTPMVAGQARREIVIFYTESAGDDRLRAVLAAAAKEVTETAAR
jgi:hypothetical protein